MIGGGFGGSSVAKYLKLWGGGAVDITIVDINASYISPILSNLVLNGQKTLQNLSFNLQNTATRTGIKFIQGSASINKVRKEVTVVRTGVTNQVLAYDRLVMSPGIDFDYTNIPSLPIANGSTADASLPIPHAWKSGAQVTNLKAQIDRMPRGGTFVLCIPKKPYRCPPGPYERACVVADIVKRVKGTGKVIVFDANLPTIVGDKYSAIQAETHTFTTAFSVQFAGIVEYVSAAKLIEVGSTGGQFGQKYVKVQLNDGTGSIREEFCHVLNVIPPHKAGKIAFDAELIPSGNFVPVDLKTYATIADPTIYVIGDAHNSTQPKAGHIANSEAKVCADAILRELGVSNTVYDLPVTNSACYSPITNSTASWLTAGYRFDDSKALAEKMVRVPESFNEAQAPSADNYKMMLAWANNLFADTFSV